MRTDAQRDRTARIRQAAMRADALRSLMPLASVDDAVRNVIERRLHDTSDVPRGIVKERRG